MAGKIKDLTGQRFGKLVVVKVYGIDKWGGTIWECKCDCGNITRPGVSNLRSGNTKSCGCFFKETVGLNGKNKFKYETGNKYGKLVVVKLYKMSKRGEAIWECKCNCGNITYSSGSNLRRGNTKSCGCFLKETARLKGIKRRNGTTNITGSYLGRIKRNARIRNLEFDITKEYLQELLEKQNFKCALSGRDLVMMIENTYQLGKGGINTASLDRIDSSKGYVEGNVQWTHKDVNIAKQDLSDQDFIKLCYNVADHSRKITDKELQGLLP